MYQKIATITTIGMAIASGASAQDPSTTTAATVGSTPVGPKFKWNAQIVAQRFYPNDQKDHWDLCNDFCKPIVDQNHLLGNINTPVDSNQWLCQCLTTEGGYTLQTTDDTWYAFKGSHVNSVASSRRRKVLQNSSGEQPIEAINSQVTDAATEETDDMTNDANQNMDTTDDNTTETNETNETTDNDDPLGSRPIGNGYMWQGKVLHQKNFPASGGTWEQCNPYCQAQSGITQYNLLGNAKTAGSTVTCQCLKYDGSQKLVSAGQDWYAFAGSHVPY
jgi:hypothetical protein